MKTLPRFSRPFIFNSFLRVEQTDSLIAYMGGTWYSPWLLFVLCNFSFNCKFRFRSSSRDANRVAFFALSDAKRLWTICWLVGRLVTKSCWSLDVEDKSEFRHTIMDEHCFGVCLDSRDEDDNQYEEEERRPVVTPNLRMEFKDDNMDEDDDGYGVINVVPSDSTVGIMVWKKTDDDKLKTNKNIVTSEIDPWDIRVEWFDRLSFLPFFLLWDSCTGTPTKIFIIQPTHTQTGKMMNLSFQVWYSSGQSNKIFFFLQYSILLNLMQLSLYFFKQIKCLSLSISLILFDEQLRLLTFHHSPCYQDIHTS